jgi:hypothetical protein
MTDQAPPRWISNALTDLAMSLLFFGMVTPIGIVMRLAGRDRLRLRRDPGRVSYWVMCPSPDKRQAAMTRQA